MDEGEGNLDALLSIGMKLLEGKNKEVKEINLFDKQDDPETAQKKETVRADLRLSDSSDDENLYEKSDYNEYGKTVKELLKRNDTESSCLTRNEPMNSFYGQSSSNGRQLSCGNLKQINQSKPNDVYTLPHFGIRVVKPLISHQLITERMEGKQSVLFANLRWFLQKETTDKDWVISGVVVSKSTTKTSQKGSNFSVWVLSDLHGELNTISLFLFGSAYNDLWKTAVGTVVGVLNPNVLEKRPSNKFNQRELASLSIETSRHVMIFGQSKDFGTCKSTRKDGAKCTMFVNVNACEFCEFHLKQEYKNCTRRSDLQSAFGGQGLNALRNKVLGKNEVFYAGKSYTAIPAKKSSKLIQRDEERLRLLSGFGNRGPNAPNASSTGRKTKAATLDISHKQRMKDLELLKRLGGISEKQNSANVDTNQVTTKTNEIVTKTNGIVSKTNEILPKSKENRDVIKSATKTNEIVTKTNKTSETNEVKSGEKINNPNTTINKENRLEKAILSLSSFDNIDLNVPTNGRRQEAAKRKAIDYVKRNGPLKRQDPMNLKGTGTKRYPDETATNDAKKIRTDDGRTDEIQKSEFFSERFKKMMAAKSRHTDLLEIRQEELKEKYFKKLEMKERIEEKMTSTHKVQCKAVRCYKCNYTNFSASDLCKAEKHPMKVFDAVKRFFACGDCKNRTVVLTRVPTAPCKNCGGSKWERAGMAKDRTVSALYTLSIRGDEEKFINSAFTNGNLDLLVPDGD